VALLAYAGWRVTGSKVGAAWAAIREDELAASSHGIDVARYKLLAFVVGAAVAAFAGALDTHLNFFVDPTEYAFNRAVLVLVFAVVGGVATVAGPIVGAVLLTLAPEALRDLAALRMVLYGILLMLVIGLRPAGLVGGWPAAAGRLLHGGRLLRRRGGRERARGAALGSAPE
jgi:branched-chain amino acid transport system permease protein